MVAANTRTQGCSIYFTLNDLSVTTLIEGLMTVISYVISAVGVVSYFKGYEFKQKTILRAAFCINLTLSVPYVFDLS